MTIQARIVLVTLLALLPLFAIELWRDHREAVNREAAIRADALRLARLVNDQQGQIVEGGRQLLTLLSQGGLPAPGDAAGCGARLDTIAARLPQYAAIGMADMTGAVVCGTAGLRLPAANVASYDFFRRASAAAGFAIDRFELSPASGAGVLRLVRPVPDGDGRPAGVIWAELDAAWLASALAGALSLPPNAVATIADRDGTVVVRLPQSQNWIGKRPETIRRVLDRGEPGIVEAVGLDGVARVYGYVPAPVAPEGLYVAVGIDPSGAGGAGAGSLEASILWHLAAAASALLVAWLAAHLLVAPHLARLARTVRRWEAHDFAATTGLTNDRTELGRIGLGLDRVVAEFRTAAAASVQRERQLRRELTEQLVALGARNRLLLAAGHDLRQPLQVVSAVVSRLEEHPGRPVEDTWTQRAAFAVDRLSAGLDRLVEAARLQAGEPVPRPRLIEIGRLLAGLAPDWQAAARAKGLGFAVEGCDAEVRTDSEMLTSIIDNLVGNAIKYTSRGSVAVRCRVVDRLLTVAVEDTGPGIPPDQAESIFEEFFQLDPDREGLGLGLSIARRMAEALGHRLYTVPRARGSEFVIELPLGATLHEIGRKRA